MTQVDIGKETKKKFVDEVGADAVLVASKSDNNKPDTPRVSVPTTTLVAALYS